MIGITQVDGNSIALVMVAFITTVGSIMGIVLNRRTHKEITSTNGQTTGSTVQQIKTLQEKLTVDLKRHRSITEKLVEKTEQIQEELEENTKDTASIAVAFGEHLSEIQSMSDLVAWARLHMIEDHALGRRVTGKDKL